MSGQLSFSYNDEKRCYVCEQTKSLEEFPRRRRNRDGRDNRCSECNRAAVTAWYGENRDYALEYRRQWAKDHEAELVDYRREKYWANREESLAKSLAWQKANPEKRREIGQRYYWRNVERLREQNREKQRNLSPEQLERRRARQRAWRAANPEKVRADNFARRTERLDEAGRDYLAILELDPCAHCGGPSDEVDHIDAVSRGGNSDWANLTASCRSCNASKCATPLLLWMAA